METPQLDTLPDEERMEAVLAFTFHGIHHVFNLRKDPVCWTTSVSRLSTFDYDELTRLVWAAHKYAVRVQIQPGGPGLIKLVLHPRRREGGITERHPTLEDVMTRWQSHS